MDYTGTLLIASPHLEDPNFRMAVILLAHQTKNEVLGLVLNRASEKSIAEFWESVFNMPCHCSEPLYIGGPMVGPVMGLMAVPSLESPETVSDVRLTTEKDQICSFAEKPVGPFRVFLGHAGWTVDQLAAEIQSGVWHLLPADEEDLFADSSELWLRALQKSARSSLQRLIRLAELPENPGNN